MIHLNKIHVFAPVILSQLNKMSIKRIIHTYDKQEYIVFPCSYLYHNTAGNRNPIFYVPISKAQRKSARNHKDKRINRLVL